MQNHLGKARTNCAEALSQYYKKYGLVCDRLEGKQYIAFWQESSGTIIETTSNDVFDPSTPIYMHELMYKQPRNYHGVSLAD